MAQLREQLRRDLAAATARRLQTTAVQSSRARSRFRFGTRDSLSLPQLVLGRASENLQDVSSTWQVYQSLNGGIAAAAAAAVLYAAYTRALFAKTSSSFRCCGGGQLFVGANCKLKSQRERERISLPPFIFRSRSFVMSRERLNGIFLCITHRPE